MQACSQQEFPYLGTPGIILAGEDLDTSQNLVINSLSSAKQNGSIDVSGSDSTASHGSLDVGQGMVQYPISHSTMKTSFDL